MHHDPYPPFDLEHVTTIFRIVRSGAIAAEIKEFAKCSYDLAGAGLGMYPGEPDDLIGSPNGNEPTVKDAEECLAALQEAEGQTFGATGDAEAIDPALIALVIQMAIKAITAWLEKRRN